MRDIDDAARKLSAVVRALPRAPAFAFDEHLDVVAANELAAHLMRVQRGCNLAILTFLDDRVDRTTQAWQEHAEVVAATLRASLDAHAEDGQFLDLVGELATESAEFPLAWARWPEPMPHGSLTCFADGEAVALRYTQMQPVTAPGYTVVMTWAADEHAREVLASFEVG
jgi:hypothetical protein